MESVQLKVSIARKQPMLDAATGKSVWGSLGKKGVLPFSSFAHSSPHVVLLPVPGSPRGARDMVLCGNYGD